MDYNEILLFWLIIGKIHSKRAKLSHGRGGGIKLFGGGSTPEVSLLESADSKNFFIVVFHTI